MAYIPLDQESKVKGKAAIDMVGSRLGKSGSSWIQIFFIQIAGTGSILSTSPYLLPIVFGVAVYWSYCVRNLNRQLEVKEEAMINEQEQAAKEIEERMSLTPIFNPEGDDCIENRSIWFGNITNLM